MPRVERVCDAIVVGRVAVDVEADLVVFGADQRCAGQAKQIMDEGQALAVADLLLVVLDLKETAALQPVLITLPGVGFGIAPMPAALM